MKKQIKNKSVALDIFVTYFSAYSAHMIEYKGVLYPTVEHAYHCQRYDDPEILQAILAARSPFKAWEISQKCKPRQLPNFAERKIAVMSELCKAKLEQHVDVRQALIDTGDLEIVKHITTGPRPDGFWDDGIDGTGLNETGKIWMRIRANVPAFPDSELDKLVDF
jgi:ribA/ribD-fused uncharacterized protein